MIRLETPNPSAPGTPVYGGDAIADCVRSLGIPYLALNPGASFRGLHDSLVNHLGNTEPQMLLVLHEETAVAIAHGFFKASGTMMGAVLHSNVGLMHGSMAVFNAWCDRVPVLMLGATGPVDAARRRPWIDWLHTSADQASIVRDYIKWDDQPASVPAAIEAVLRAAQIAATAPCGPTYVNLDSTIQEERLDVLPAPPAAARFRPSPPAHPAPALVQEAARLLNAAERPVVLIGRVGRDEAAWQARVALAEAIDAPVVTDLKTGATFPTRHRLLASPPGFFLTPAAAALVRDADLVLSLDWVDLGGTLRQCYAGAEPNAKVIQVSPDQQLHHGWGMEYGALPPTDLYLACEPDIAVSQIAPLLEPRPARTAFDAMTPADDASGHQVIGMAQLAAALNAATAGQAVCLARLPLGWSGGYRHFDHPLDYLGYDGGAGIGSGPGMTIGAALALKGGDRVVVSVLGDGDFMMNASALWTATHYGIPLLMIIANNRSFYNDEVHQERVATERGRPVENKWIGQTICEPDIDIAMIARAQGAIGIGPIHAPDALEAAIRAGLDEVRAGRTVVIDARVSPGYASDMSGMATERGGKS